MTSSEHAPLAVPPGLQALLLQLSKAAVKQQPDDLVEFGAAYFAELLAAAKPARRPLRVVISGAPASGKGTQSSRIVQELGLVHISVGDLLRAEVAAGSELGIQARGFMESGGLVPDQLVASLVSTRLAAPDVQEHGWLLDGFPRTAAQAEALQAAGIRPDLFLSIEMPDAVLVERVAGRRLDPETGTIYHLTFKPPPSGIEGRLVQRADDTEETMRARITNHKRHCAAVASAYSDRTAAVDGNRPEDSVWEDVQVALRAAASSAGPAAHAA